MTITASEFLDSLDVANRACQILGVTQIEDVEEDSKNNKEMKFAYGKMRQTELRRNVWRFAKRTVFLRSVDDDTRIIAPHAWDEATLYLPGSIVSHTNGTIWYSTAPENVGNEPGESGVWEHYFGPSTVHLWDEDVTTGYNMGELVYILNEDYPGAFTVYMSLANDNTDVPGTGTDWDATVRYKIDDTVLYNSQMWRSLININFNNTPAEPPADWDQNIEYIAGDTVVASDGYIWEAVDTTVGNNPILDDGTYWTNSLAPAAWDVLPELPVGALTWQPLYCGVNSMDLEFLSVTLAANGRNIYRLPCGFLREARPQEFVEMPRNDHTPIGNFVATNDTQYIMHFCADITDVRTMDPLFCEGLACRVALATCYSLTQSRGAMQDIAAQYKEFMTTARLVNAIEVGPEPSDEDELITVRRRLV